MVKRTTIEYMDGSRQVLRDEYSPFGVRRGKEYSVRVDPNTREAIISKLEKEARGTFDPVTVTHKITKTESSYKPVKSVTVEEGSSCVITTACTEVFGLPDNCDELKTLRDFRDNYLMNTFNGRIAVELYYKIAPEILVIMEGEPDREKLLKRVFRNYVKPAVSLINKGKNKEAARLYIKAITYLIGKCGERINN